MKIIICNTFHNTSVSMIIQGDMIKLTSHQVKRAEGVLCGIRGCTCGKMWSLNHAKVAGYEEYHFEPIVDNRTGDVIGADLVLN